MRITEDILLKLNSLSSAITKQDYGTGVFKDLQSKIKPPPERGSLDVTSVKNSRYFFS